MKKYWLFREEFYRNFHLWPYIVAFIAIGCLAGWLCSFMWPSYYRATTQVYVGLNPYRAYSDTNFLALSKPRYANLDNYLYWQMYQLEGAIFLPEIIEETLDKLRQTDEYWEKIETSQLANMLDAEWRTAGLWSLTASNPKANRASQVVRAWSEIAVKRIKDSVQYARKTITVENQLQAVAQDLRDMQARQKDMQLTRVALLEWSAEVRDGHSTEPLEQAERWRILNLATRLALYTPSWQQVLESQPSADSFPAAYLAWIDQIVPQIDAELPILEQQISELEKERDNLQEEYSIEAEKSLSLSPNLEMKKVVEIPTKNIRPKSTLILIGGIIGLLIWVLYQLFIIAYRVKYL